MTSAPTPIRTLMNMRHIAHLRNDAVEAASKAEDWLESDWARASRLWSRQAEALLLAVIAESPSNLDDVLSVMICLAEIRHQHDTSAELSPYRDRDVAEMTDIAVHNCVRALAANVVPQDDLPESEIRDVDWSVKQVQHWLPEPGRRRREKAA